MCSHDIPIIAVTGGKGGTGKTLVAINLAVKFSLEGKKVLLIDCDVENPNTHILLGKKLQDQNVQSKPITIFIPSFDESLCIQCGDCREGCYRHAILQFPNSFPSLLEHMCSGCETCMRICSQKAIKPGSRIIGTEFFLNQAYKKLDLLIGELKPSEAVSALIVKAILKDAKSIHEKNQYDIIIIDTSPGAHCDVEMALFYANLILCVTEPTPFGEHDLNRILQLIELIHHQAYILLNRADMSDYRKPIFELSKKKYISIIGEIPLDDIIIEDYAKGVPFVCDDRDFPAKKAFSTIFQTILEKINHENTIEGRI